MNLMNAFLQRSAISMFNKAPRATKKISISIHPKRLIRREDKHFLEQLTAICTEKK